MKKMIAALLIPALGTTSAHAAETMPVTLKSDYSSQSTDQF
jgi:hypothetical protein